MSVITVTKKGGPYSKKDQMIRRDKVFHLHFEYGNSAAKISTRLNVNRNTINSDIKYWYTQLSKNWVSNEINFWCIKQMQRLEFQRSRLFAELEKQEGFKEKHMIEKLLFEIDDRMLQLIFKIKEKDNMYLGKAKKPKDEKQIVLELLQELPSKGNHNNYPEDEIIFNLMKHNSWIQDDASRFLDEMLEYGLEFFECKKKDKDDDSKYDLKEFAKFRGYIKD